MSSAIPKKTVAIQVALLALGLFLFQLSLTPPATDYLGFTGLRWQESDGCREGGAYTELQPSLGSVGSWISGGGEHTGSCKSELVEALGPIVEFEYGGYPSSEQDKLAEILLWRSDRTLPQSLHLDYPHLAHLGETWRRARVELDQFSPGVKIGFELRDQAEVAHGGWLAQRSRVSFFGSSESAGYWYRLLNTPILRLANWLLIAASLVLLLTGPLGTLKGWKAFAIFFVIAIGVHYRHDLYFYWDEWHVLLRLLEPGKRVFLETHNEHFIPLFLGIFYLESLLFGDNYNLYLLFGLAIHALNGVLTASLIRRLIDSRIGGESAVGARAANSLAVFYLVNALHCSVLEWAFLQAILFCQLLALSAFVNGLDYVREGDRLKLSLCLISAALAPFFFGGGMIIPVQMGLLVLFGVPFLLRKLQRAFGGLALSGDAEEETEDDTKNDAALKRSGYLALMFCFLGVALIAIYAVPREGSGYGVDVPNIAHRFGDLTKLVGYMFVGTQLGSIVRGLGLFPIRELDLTINLIPPEWIQIFDNKFFVFGAIGSFALIAAAGLFLVLRAFSLNPRDTIRILLLGQAFLLSSLFLAALGRSKWGMLFSLAPRYQYSALIGLLICLLPVTLWLLSTHAGTHSVLRKMLLGTFVGCLMLQLYWGARYQLFVEYAQMNRGFVEQLSEWHGLVQRNAPENRQAPYDRAGTPFTGLAPGIPWRLAPNFHPDQVSAVVEALRRRETITAIPDYDS